MTRTVPKGAALALACLALLHLVTPAAAARHHRPRVFCAPVVIEGRRHRPDLRARPRPLTLHHPTL